MFWDHASFKIRLVLLSPKSEKKGSFIHVVLDAFIFTNMEAVKTPNVSYFRVEWVGVHQTYMECKINYKMIKKIPIVVAAG